MRYFLIVFLTIFSFTTFAQTGEPLLQDTPLREDQLPPQVSSQFQKHNPEIEHATWTQEGENYAASYEKEGKNIRSEYNYDGTWIGDFRPIDMSEVPSAVIQQVEEEFSDYQIQETYSVETEEGRLYQFLVSDGTDENSIRFDEDGNQVEIGESLDNEIMEDSK